MTQKSKTKLKAKPKRKPQKKAAKKPREPKTQFREKPVLFERFPGLEAKVPWIKLGQFPTPVHQLKKLGKKLGTENFWVKREDQSGLYYGGNKVRKLEFSLAQAVRSGKGVIVTFGGAGSNHVLATTIYGNTLGLTTAAFMMPQPPSKFVTRNIRAYSHHGAKLFYWDGKPKSARALLKKIPVKWLRNAYILPPGGSNVQGTVGFVDAALEIRKQVDEKQMPEPDYIFVAGGSGGSMAGLIVGTTLAGLKSKVIGIRVADEQWVNRFFINGLANRTAKFLHEMDNSIPFIKFKKDQVNLVHDYFGKEYGRFTPEGDRAMELAEKLEGLLLEGTYTAKALAAAMDHAERNPEAVTLFINTYNSVDLYSDLPEKCDIETIPEGMRRHLENY